jgi:hypothetical protein
LNGASIGTETITLTDPNASAATFNPPTSYTITGPPSDGYYPGYEIIYDASSILPSGYPGTSGTKYYYGIGASGSIFSGGYYFYWDSSNNTWNDAAAGDGQADPVSFSYSATPVVNGTIITGIGGQGADFIFTMSGIVSSSTPTYRTGTSQGFAFTSGNWKNNGYSAVLDDEANSSEGKLVNGVRQWEFDMPDIGGGRLSSGASHWIHFVPGTAEDNGTWYRGGSVGTRSGRTINFGNDATFDETSAFVSGLVPYGDIP